MSHIFSLQKPGNSKLDKFEFVFVQLKKDKFGLST